MDGSNKHSGDFVVLGDVLVRYEGGMKLLVSRVTRFGLLSNTFFSICRVMPATQLGALLV